MGLITRIYSSFAAFALALSSAMQGCATKPLDTNSSNNYELIVRVFGFDSRTIIYQFTVGTPLDVPFRVEKHDKAGKYYKVSGTLRQMPEGTFKLESGIIESYPSLGAGGEARDIYLGKLGEGHGWGSVDGIVHDGGSVLVSKESL